MSQRVRLSGAAEKDFVDILNWTAEKFGLRQVEVYNELLQDAFDALAGDPTFKTSARDEISKGLRSAHVPRPGRHILLYRLTPEADVLIIRILHDSMELTRHILPEDEP